MLIALCKFKTKDYLYIASFRIFAENSHYKISKKSNIKLYNYNKICYLNVGII
ncbi:hypothetical protein D3C85_364560 [compost metagenome]